MVKSIKMITAASALAVVLGNMVAAPLASAAEANVVAEGKKIAFDRKLGNCLACHAIEGGSLPGNIGPPLVNMKERYPDKAKLRAQIFDATQTNPNTIMPPFGRYGILSEQELDKVVEFIHSL